MHFFCWFEYIQYTCSNTHKKKTDYYKILKNLNEKILKLGVKKIEYLELIDVDTNTKISDKTKKFKIFISYYLGGIRLIDNV